MIPRKGPLYHHLTDAIKINRHRMPLYSALTNGKSISLSQRLIASELFCLPFALFLDGITHDYRKNGILIGDLEYVDMKNIPEFQEKFSFTPEPISAFTRVNTINLKNSLTTAWDKIEAAEDFATLEMIALEQLKKLEQPRAYHCMMRHILESIARAANLAPQHDALAKTKGMKSTVSLSKWIIWGHFPAIGPAADLDADLAPLQSQGIPILFQDVPHIPTSVKY
jgi:hypothetical protein